jgi:predicted small secreted protein
MKNITVATLMLAVAALASGCHKADNNTNGMGPAQSAGKAVDDAGSKVATETREGAAVAGAVVDKAGENAKIAADHAGDKIENAADRAGDKAQQAGAEVRQESHEAAQNVKEGASKATTATGKAVERAGEKIQDAAK